jgi:hypothetical protein
LSCLFLVTASRMRACACDTASRLCVRSALCRSAFSLGPPLRSTGSAAADGRFVRPRPRYLGQVRLLHRTHRRLRPPAFPTISRTRLAGMETSPFGFCACQSLRRRGVGMCLAISTPALLPTVGRKTSAPRTCLTPLNTSPAPSPVNASRLPSRASVHHSGPVRFATPSP